MNENRDNFEDRTMRELLASSKLIASENLQHRIMQQICTEKALMSQNTKSVKPILKTVLGIGLVMYFIVIVIGILAYTSGGFEALGSSTFILPVVGISMICSVYGLITVLDEKRYRH